MDKSVDVSFLRETEQIGSIGEVLAGLSPGIDIVAAREKADRQRIIARSLGPNAYLLVAVVVMRGAPRLMLFGRCERRVVPLRIGYRRVAGVRVSVFDVIHDGVHLDARCDEAELVRMVQAVRDRMPAELCEFHRLSGTAAGASGRLQCVLRALGGWTTASGPNWRMSLPESFDLLLNGFSPKHRKNVEREWKLLARALEAEPVVQKFACPSEAGDFVSRASAIIAKTYHAKLGIGVGDSGLIRPLIEHDARQGRFRGFILSNGRTDLAYAYATRTVDELSLLAMGYDPAWAKFSVGKALMLRMFRSTIEEGVRIIDFGFGDAEYKRVYGNSFEPETSWCLAKFGARGLILRGFSAAERAATGALGTLPGSAVLKQRLKRWLRRRSTRE